MRTTIALLAALLSIAPSLALAQAPPTAQTAPPRTDSPDPAEFVRFAHSSASLQARAARIAAERETRPEVKQHAPALAAFHESLLGRITELARRRGLPIPADKEFGHQVVIENLEPLDYLALSRRYAEIQAEAIDREIGLYRAAARSQDPDIKDFAAQTLPDLERLAREAHAMHDAVKP